MRLSHLNPSQRKAVETTEGPLLVLAGAGSGKTRVITHRIQHLLELGIPADMIVALSFTNKAAGEMRERLHSMVGKQDAGKLVLSTFHSLGVMMLRREPSAFGLPKRWSIADQGDVYGIVRGLLREFGVHGVGGDKRYDLGAIVQRISLWKNEFVEPEDAKAQADKWGTVYDEVAGLIYGPYFERLRALGAVDFDDLVCRVALGLRNDDELRERWQSRFRYLMVDEYQDTNPAQFELLNQLLGPEQNICVVGDDDQAIYGWRGAKVENILGFDIYFPTAQVVRLQENYRSFAPILKCANAVIRHNDSRHDKKLIPTRGSGSAVLNVKCRDPQHETDWVCGKIRTLIVDENQSGDDIAVLYRSARQARSIEEQLQAHGLSYRVLGGQSFYDKKEVKDAIAYLKCIVAPHDDLAVRRALDTPPRGIGSKTIERLAGWAEVNNRRLMDAVNEPDRVEGLGPRQLDAVKRFAAKIEATREQATQRKSVAEPLQSLLRDVGFRDNIYKETGSAEATQTRWDGVEWLFRSVERFETRVAEGGRGRWSDYLGNLTLDRSETQGDAEEQLDRGRITLATLHSSKGLEWPHVFIVGCEEGVMPHKRVEAVRISDAIAGDIEEERRLFYVGVTRARDQLYLTRSAHRVDRGREVEVMPSRFLGELPSDSPDAVRDYEVVKEEVLDQGQMDAMTDAFFEKFSSEGDIDFASLLDK